MLQHQIVQSPARLGLTNPNSPSLPQTQQHPQTTPSTSASALALAVSVSASNSPSPATSNGLLSLLPPLRRAQSLLAQMASLASRLFEVSPNRSAWLASYRGSLPNFLSSVGPAGPGSAKEVLAQFAVLQKQLFEAVAQLQEILDLQDSRAKIAREVSSRDAAALSFAARLKDAERLLDDLLDDYSHYRKPPKNDEDEVRRDENDDDDDEGDSATMTVKSRLNLSDVLSYAHRISYTTFAPPEFGAGESPLRGALPPAPQDEQMRASQLYTLANLDVGLAAAEPDNHSFEPMIDQPLLPPPPPAGSEFGRFPENITVPAGWKPGMPVELPMDIPLPPPGWKPGDPVPLPPVGSMPSFLPSAPRPANPAGETIQVRHVDLDILDQDDSSSDYSSDDASSSDD